MMVYLRRTDYHRYKLFKFNLRVISEYNIPDQPPINHHHKENMRLIGKIGAKNGKSWCINNNKFH